MKYLIDTDVIINYLRARLRLEKRFLEEGGGISIITLGELVYGAYKSDLPQHSLAVALDFIRESGLQVVDLNQETIYNFGTIKAELEKTGKRLEDFDLLIAATAKVSNLILVTKNINHFKRIKGLQLI